MSDRMIPLEARRLAARLAAAAGLPVEEEALEAAVSLLDRRRRHELEALEAELAEAEARHPTVAAEPCACPRCGFVVVDVTPPPPPPYRPDRRLIGYLEGGQAGDVDRHKRTPRDESYGPGVNVAPDRPGTL